MSARVRDPRVRQKCVFVAVRNCVSISVRELVFEREGMMEIVGNNFCGLRFLSRKHVSHAFKCFSDFES